MPIPCSVEYCHNRARYRFPRNPDRRRKWLLSIRQPNLQLKPSSGVCGDHFLDDDFAKESYYTGLPLVLKILKRDSIPSVFKWPDSSSRETGDKDKSNTKNTSRLNHDATGRFDESNATDTPHTLSERALVSDLCEVVRREPEDFSCDIILGPQSFLDQCIQTEPYVPAPYTISNFEFKPALLHHLTGISTYDKFMEVLSALSPGIKLMTYEGKHHYPLDVGDQLFLVLWKLRRNPSDIELGMHFGVSAEIVASVFKLLIKLMSHLWSKSDVWPQRNVVNHHLPKHFKLALNTPLQNKEIPNLKKSHKKRMEKLISLASNYKIVSSVLHRFHRPIASEIYFVCITLVNFSVFNEGVFWSDVCS